MNVTYTFKHMKSSDSVVSFSKEHIVEPTLKLLGEGLQVKLIFDGPQPDFSINTLLTASNGTQFKVKETGKNMYVCIDAAGKKLVRMIRKEKNMNTSYKNSSKANENFTEGLEEEQNLKDEQLAQSDKGEVFATSVE